MDISGASAIVTGGAGGLGGATVRRLVAAGAHVVIAHVATDKGQELAQELGSSVKFVKTDTSSESSVQQALDEAVRMGPFRISVAAHGGFAAGGRTLKAAGGPHSLEDFRNVIDAYLVGTFNVLRLASAAMSKSEAPAIPFPKRMGQPAEYAKLVQSIVENSYLNGEVIRIDGAVRFGPRSPK